MAKNILKTKAAFVYIISKFDGIDILRAFKILYFANKDHLARYGRAIIDDDFCALPNGPVPSNIYDAVKKAQGKTNYFPFEGIDEIVNAINIDSSGEFDYIIYSNEEPDCDELSKSDIECLERSYNENKDLSFKELSSKSHDLAWENAWETKHASKIDVFNMARAAGAGEEMVNYIEENINIDNILV